MSSPKRRMEKDVMDLMMSDHDVQLIDDNIQQMYVLFEGPEDTPYKGGTWRVRVELPDQYPIKSPSIGFINKIFHPNIDESSGSVCLDVINQTWSPMFGLLNVFENFLPHLLRYANPSDPLNTDASNLMSRDEQLYTQKVREYVAKFAQNITNDHSDWQDDNDKDVDEDELSDVGSLSSDDYDAVAGDIDL
ncbi:hypothetical protein CANTEDRAFT_112946 [Yamadazyma tenuis ATCC 10573]|uniref:UBC core domain-containing protein n=1 Tax=Candida tenuis (strain ATCC 10573 / BCRC 21748 / CBS 615 / JCM 9827 / NBRC 10315 / NRRL Y-1498 / VKM Y-70) TaxID=590646 RepID=G3AZF7_CANTC|nr:uncharacterized protein CANTEDRAFT_112946 [Yamadazyma tenuis ATCC 10573]EGV66084.1 hypothetical protein CANTEDRAFT_112946 [Yamadazyma tenuis ATCC 10573]